MRSIDWSSYLCSSDLPVLTLATSPGNRYLSAITALAKDWRGARAQAGVGVGVGLGVGVTVTGPPPNVPPSPPPHDASISAASVTAAIGRLDLAIKLLPRFDPFSAFCLRLRGFAASFEPLRDDIEFG